MIICIPRFAPSNFSWSHRKMMRFLDEEMGTAAELRHVRLLVHDAVERTGMCVYFHVFSVYVSRCVCGACVRVYMCKHLHAHTHTHRACTNLPEGGRKCGLFASPHNHKCGRAGRASPERLPGGRRRLREQMQVKHKDANAVPIFRSGSEQLDRHASNLKCLKYSCISSSLLLPPCCFYI